MAGAVKMQSNTTIDREITKMIQAVRFRETEKLPWDLF